MHPVLLNVNHKEMYFGTHLVDWLLVAAQRWIDWRELDAIVPVALHSRRPSTSTTARARPSLTSRAMASHNSVAAEVSVASFASTMPLSNL